MYISNEGKYQVALNEYTKLLVPRTGKASTLEGEMLRASAELYYDYYEYGMSCNTSGSLNFLLCIDSSKDLGIRKELLSIMPYCNQGLETEVDLSKSLEDIVDKLVEYVVLRRGSYSENPFDLDDFADNDFHVEDFQLAFEIM